MRVLGSRAHTVSPVRRTAAALLAAALPAALLTVPTAGAQAAPTGRAPTRQITYTDWTGAAELRQGRFLGTRATRGGLVIADRPRGRTTYRDPHGYRTRTYEWGRWVSPWRTSGYGFTELIASWDARTPRHTWLEVEMRARSEAGRRSSWDSLGRWSSADRTFHRTSLGAQTDDLGRVAVDTWRGNFSMAFEAWQLRVTLHRKQGTSRTPRVETVGAMVSRLPSIQRVKTSRPGPGRGQVVPVPRYSQMIHEGDYPEYDSGGEAWCSPTSVSMVLGAYGKLPRKRAYRWVKEPHPNRFVDHAARMHYDFEYDGAGNWPFSTAYAATQAGNGYVTRLRGLREAERFIAAGIPLVASIAFEAGELDRSPLTSTNGHLLVIRGFTAAGDVIANDPAAPRNRGVRRVYDRGQFENAWLPASGGLVYVIRPDGVALPESHRGNW